MSRTLDYKKLLDTYLGKLNSFSAHKQPEYGVVNNIDYVLWGLDPHWKNRQPEYYEWLYNSSSKHRAIINTKSTFVSGRGFELISTDLDLNKKIQSEAFLIKLSESDIIPALSRDLVTYGGFCWEVIPSKDQKTIMPFYVPFGKVRRSKPDYKDGKEIPIKYYYTSNWDTKGKKPEQNPDWTEFEAFDPANYDRSKRYLVYYSYSPEMLYPLPEYTAAIPYIAADYEVANFVYNNTKDGFTGGWLFNFFNGTPTEDQKEQISADIDAALHGSDNAGKSLKVFNEQGEAGLEATPLSSNGQDDRYVNLNLQIREEIFAGHVIDPIIAGLKGETGFNNNADEKRVAIDSFQNFYVSPHQRTLEKHINTIMKFNGLGGIAKIKKLQSITDQVSEAEIAAIATADERRERAGLPKLARETNPVAEALSTMSPLLANKILESMSVSEIRGLVGLTGQTLSKETKTTETHYHSIDDLLVRAFELTGSEDEQYDFFQSKELCAHSFAEAEQQSKDFLFASMFDINVLKMLISGTSLKDIAKSLKVPASQITESIERLEAEGLTSKGTPTDKGARAVEENELMVVYKYVKRRDASGGDIIETSRPFCRRMVALSKTRSWTRDEIDLLNNGQGLDVFESRGGWFKLPNGASRPSCRHVWSANIVRRK